MIDVSQVTSYDMILLCVFGALLLIGFLKGLLGGFWKSVIKFALWVALIIAIIKFAPILGAQLATTGIIENLIGMIGNTQIVNFVLGLIGTGAYTILAGLCMLIAGAIVIGLISMITKSLFKKKRFLSRIVAAIFSTAFNAVIVTALFIVASSPLLFKGAQEHINSNQYLVMYQDYVVDPVQDVLTSKGLPSSVEEVTLVALKQAPTQENVAKLGNVITLMTHSKDVLASMFTTDNDGNINGLNEANAKAVYSDVVFFAKIVNDMEEGTTKEEMSLILQLMLQESLTPLVHEGVAVATVTVPAAEYDAMNVYMANLGFTSLLEHTVNAVFVK